MPAFNPEHYRVLHRKRGERYRWFRAMPSGLSTAELREFEGAERDGHIYVEQSIPDDARALVSQTTEEVQSEEYGLFPVGSTRISVMPDESYFGRLDKIILTDRRFVSRVVLTRGATALDVLPRGYVQSITEVRRGTTVYVQGVDYQMDASGVTWLDNAPTVGETYAVDYQYSPVYLWLRISTQPPRIGSDGNLMPLRGMLSEELPTGGAE